MKVLLVEDDFSIRDLYLKAFTSGGYEVEMAADGQEAMDKVQNNTYDVILLDIMLPKISGLDVLKSFRDPYSSVKDKPIFLITNLGQEEIVKEAYKIGVSGFFLKARVTPQELVEKVNAAMANPQAAINPAETPGV